jgi:CRP-like cAMP-binding protein
VTSSEAARIVRSVLCRGLTFEQADQIIKAMVPVTAQAGTVVLREGERSQGLLVLLEGSAEVLKQGRDGGEVLIASVEAPTVLGEMSQFDRLIKSESLAAYKVVATLADVIAWRLGRMDEKFVELSRQGAGVAPVEELAVFKNKVFTEWNL